MSATTTSATTFREEWITIGNNRVLVSERDGPPGPWVRRLAMIAAWYLEGNGELDLRVVAVWLDNRHTTAYRVTIAGDCEADRHLFVSLAEILREFLSGPWVTRRPRSPSWNSMKRPADSNTRRFAPMSKEIASALRDTLISPNVSPLVETTA
jgi:hypothetical protein